MATNKMLSIEAVCNIFGGFTKQWLYKQIKLGLFTKPLKFGKCSRWFESEAAAICLARANNKSDDEIRALVQKLHAARVSENA
ncbi:MAG: hypothetical protein IKZ87_03950 [Actinomycetaceae bacterium]|nr:hypothetical protein [Actinomycetaceae bacterium]